MMKIQPLDGSRDDMRPCVARGRYASRGVNQFYDNAAVNITRRIGTLGIHDLSHDYSAFTYFFPLHNLTLLDVPDSRIITESAMSLFNAG
jgi:hypothetical protein